MPFEIKATQKVLELVGQEVAEVFARRTQDKFVTEQGGKGEWFSAYNQKSVVAAAGEGKVIVSTWDEAPPEVKAKLAALPQTPFAAD